MAQVTSMRRMPCEVVFVGLDGIGGDGEPETGPAGAGIELLVGREQGSVAGATVVDAVVVVVDEGAGEGVFGAFLAHDVELLGGEELAPFSFSFVDLLFGRGAGAALYRAYQTWVGSSVSIRCAAGSTVRRLRGSGR